MRISGGSALAKDEIERMIKEAEEHADEDRKRREEAEVRNTAEQLVYSTEKFLRDNDDKLPAEGKAEVTSAIGDLKKALEGTDIADVKAKHEALSTASQTLGAALYAQQSEPEAAPNTTGGETDADRAEAAAKKDAEDDVVDAEIVDEDK